VYCNPFSDVDRGQTPRGRGQNPEDEDKAEDKITRPRTRPRTVFLSLRRYSYVSNYTRQSSHACMPHTKKNYNLIISANILPIVMEASQMAVSSKFVLGWHGTYCRMQIIGLGFVVKYTIYAQGQVTKCEDMPKPDARGRGRGQNFGLEDSLASRS